MMYDPIYERINWENEEVSRKTALGAINLNKMDYALYEHDKRIVNMDARLESQEQTLETIADRTEEIKGQVSQLSSEIDKQVVSISEEIKIFTTHSFECEIPMEIGGIDGTGIEYAATHRGRSVYTHCMHPLLTLHVPLKYKWRLCLYKHSHNQFYAYTDWFTGDVKLKDIIEYYQLTNGDLVTFRILIGNQDDSELPGIDTITLKTPPKEKDAPYIKSDLLSEVSDGYACGHVPFLANGYYLSPPIRVKPNTAYETYAIRNYALYSNDFQFIHIGSGGGGTTITTPNNEDIAYLVYCWKNTDNNFDNMAFAESGKLIGGYAFEGIVPAEPCKWVAMGDSITAGYYSTAPKTQGFSSEKSWTKYVADKKGYKLTNIAIGGSGYVDSTHATDHTNAKMKADATDFSGVDLVTLAYGVNDWKYGFAIGSVSDDKNAGNTMASNMKYVIEKILADNPHTKIIVITPVNCMGYDFNYGDFSANYGLGYTMPENGKTLEEVFEVQKAICEYYGIQMIDNTHNSVVNRVNIASMLLDGVHPTIECYEVMGKELAEKITY